jgi:hypothetical protein
MPTPVVYAPTEFGGIGLTNLIYEQGIAYTIYVTKHIRHNTDTASTIIIILESYMLSTGTTNSPLQDLTEYPYVDSPWLQTLRSFLRQSNSTISIPQLSGPQLIRAHDQAIMSAITHLNFSNHQLRLINECRIWLQITTLAEITDIDGTNILIDAFRGTAEPPITPTLWMISQSTLGWPATQRPDQVAWKLWQRAIRHFTCGNSTKLHHPLGKWYIHWNQQRTLPYFLHKTVC